MWPFSKRASSSIVGHPASKDGAMQKLFNINSGTVAGVDVIPSNAMQIEAVFGCVRVIAETISTLPLFLMERKPDGTTEKAVNHPLFQLMHTSPNPSMTSCEFGEVIYSQLELNGNAFVDIVRDSAGRPVQLWPIPPHSVRVKATGWSVQYFVRTVTGEREVPADNIMHLKFLPGSDGIMGVDPITAMREGLGLSIAARNFGASFFGNGATMGSVLTHPGALSEKAQENIRRSIQDKHKGSGNANQMMILEEGMTYAPLGVNPDNAQFLETRKFQTAEIAGRIFRVPPHMIGDLEKATFSNIEEQGINFSRYTILPRTIRNEQAFNKALLTEEERKTYFFHYNLDGLLRGDINSRYKAHQVGIMSGFLNRNEVRRMENTHCLSPSHDSRS